MENTSNICKILSINPLLEEEKNLNFLLWKENENDLLEDLNRLFEQDKESFITNMFPLDLPDKVSSEKIQYFVDRSIFTPTVVKEKETTKKNKQELLIITDNKDFSIFKDIDKIELIEGTDEINSLLDNTEKLLDFEKIFIQIENPEIFMFLLRFCILNKLRYNFFIKNYSIYYHALYYGILIDQNQKLDKNTSLRSKFKSFTESNENLALCDDVEKKIKGVDSIDDLYKVNEMHLPKLLCSFNHLNNSDGFVRSYDGLIATKNRNLTNITTFTKYFLKEISSKKITITERTKYNFFKIIYENLIEFNLDYASENFILSFFHDNPDSIEFFYKYYFRNKNNLDKKYDATLAFLFKLIIIHKSKSEINNNIYESIIKEYQNNGPKFLVKSHYALLYSFILRSDFPSLLESLKIKTISYNNLNTLFYVLPSVISNEQLKIILSELELSEIQIRIISLGILRSKNFWIYQTEFIDSSHENINKVLQIFTNLGITNILTNICGLLLNDTSTSLESIIKLSSADLYSLCLRSNKEGHDKLTESLINELLHRADFEFCDQGVEVITLSNFRSKFVEIDEIIDQHTRFVESQDFVLSKDNYHNLPYFIKLDKENSRQNLSEYDFTHRNTFSFLK